jgi:hypothetical protein
LSLAHARGSIAGPGALTVGDPVMGTVFVVIDVDRFLSPGYKPNCLNEHYTCGDCFHHWLVEFVRKNFDYDRWDMPIAIEPHCRYDVRGLFECAEASIIVEDEASNVIEYELADELIEHVNALICIWVDDMAQDGGQ